MGDLIRINYSQMAEFLRCRYRWDLAYNSLLTPRAAPRPQAMGIVIHRTLQALVTQEPMDEDELLADIGAGWWESEEEAKKTLIEGVSTANRFWDWFNEDGRWTVIADLIEKELSVEVDCMGIPVVLHGTPDIVAIDRETGYSWLIDYKTSKTMPESAINEETNLQSAVYQYLLYKHAVQTHGFIRADIYAGMPKLPVLNKDGSMSRADIRTTWPVYRAALVSEGLNPADYYDMRDKLEAKDWWRITQTYRPAPLVGRIFETVIKPLLTEMVILPYPSRAFGSHHCSNCWARDWCLAEIADDRPTLEFLREYRMKHPSDDLRDTPMGAVEWALSQELD